MSFLPSFDRRYLEECNFTFEEVQDGAQKALIIRGYALSEGKYDANEADILILLPSGYPDVAPDMFHTFPWLKLVPKGTYPSRADHPVNFAEIQWQRWSRHSDDWRSGVDGIHTVIRRVDVALKVAV